MTDLAPLGLWPLLPRVAAVEMGLGSLVCPPGGQRAAYRDQALDLWAISNIVTRSDWSQQTSQDNTTQHNTTEWTPSTAQFQPITLMIPVTLFPFTFFSVLSSFRGNASQNSCTSIGTRVFVYHRHSLCRVSGFIMSDSPQGTGQENNDIPLKVTHVLSRQEKHPNTISDEYTSPPCLMQHRRLEMPGMLDSSPMGDHVPLIGYQCPHPQEQCPR
ncbi:hypothetical protein DPX16_20488 [Anabarilius grahami]|uniref:Uncharacterized protein n=1 Tax=Anabarilius grahami TaxID=495550 RepID=A0A3N0YKR0_ANAGA|nr:hypothetical protein DPX16_20488 [Anabarilius grahami]